MYSINQAYFHINPPPVLVLSFKCTEIDDFGTDVFLDASLTPLFSKLHWSYRNIDLGGLYHEKSKSHRKNKN